MYEAREHKEKVSRRIDGGGARQRVKIHRMTALQFLHPNDKAIQKMEITLTSSLGSVSGQSAKRNSLPHFFSTDFPIFGSWWKTNVKPQRINKVTKSIHQKGQRGKWVDKEITRWEDRSPYQCAEPDALNKFLEAVKANPQDFNPNESIHFDSCAHDGTYYEYPCAVCKQWVGTAPENKKEKIELKNKPFMIKLKEDIQKL